MKKIFEITEIENYSGVDIKNIHRNVPLLKPKHYKALDFPIGGDAPKDFIQAYIYGDSRKANPNKWSKYIAKVGHKWYPLESVNEHLLNRIGEVLGLKMAKSHIRLFGNQLRFLSLYFRKKDEELVHGANIYSAFLNEEDTQFVQEIEDAALSREFFTFQFTVKAIKTVFQNDDYQSILMSLVNMLMFDAIVGNNDRHFYNWGVLRDIRGGRKPYFSPIYDSARGLFWNYSEEKIESIVQKGTIIDEIQFDRYIRKSLPKIGWQDEKKINHFKLIEKIYSTYPEYRKSCRKLSNNVHLQNVLQMLNKEFCNFYSEKRLILIEECLKRRFSSLQQICTKDN